jgi:aspartate racemase
MKEKIVGIIGGLGPEATVDLMRRVIQATPAGDDQDHIRMIVDCNPKVPSRIKAILEGTGEDPAPYLVTMAKDLAAWGADFLVIACNTAHLYFDRIQEAVPLPVLNMIDLTVDKVVSENPAIRKAGLLASWTVIRPGLYGAAFEKRGVALLHPSTALQDRLLTAIRRIKTGHHGAPEKKALEEAGWALVDQGAEVLIIACTELSVIAEGLKMKVRIFDASQILAEAIVHTVKGGSICPKVIS